MEEELGGIACPCWVLRGLRKEESGHFLSHWAAAGFCMQSPPEGMLGISGQWSRFSDGTRARCDEEPLSRDTEQLAGDDESRAKSAERK